jgi:transcriptional regulator with XRE-family HTH domain
MKASNKPLTPEQLKSWRQARELSQNELADLLGVEVGTISRWERGQRVSPAFLPLALKTISDELNGGRRK